MECSDEKPCNKSDCPDCQNERYRNQLRMRRDAEKECDRVERQLAAYRFVFVRKFWGNAEFISALKMWQPDFYEIIMADLKNMELKPPASE